MDGRRADVKSCMIRLLPCARLAPPQTDREIGESLHVIFRVVISHMGYFNYHQFLQYGIISPSFCSSLNMRCKPVSPDGLFFVPTCTP